MLILLIDGSVLLFLWLGIAAMWIMVSPWLDPIRQAFYYWLAVCYVYLTILKPSIRTLGYLLTDTRIVTIRGGQPSVLRMTFRLMLWVFGPVDTLIDLFWAGNDEESQTLRDRIAGTYVVRAQARPIGRGTIHLKLYLLLGMSLMFQIVSRTSDVEKELGD
ncbi:RDD family protein [Acidimicrobium ferrooxidans]|nr:RDD family protein [Acidimicrobium ferrooxidans]